MVYRTCLENRSVARHREFESHLLRMSLWLLIIGALTLQEGLSTTVVLLEAVHNHYPLILIHLIWLVVTVAQIYLGYYIGKWIQTRYKYSKFERWLEKYARKLDDSVGKRGELLALLLASAIVSPAATALLASWLDISITRIVTFALLGDFLWYLSEWATVVGANALLTGVKYGAILVLASALIWLVLSHTKKRA